MEKAHIPDSGLPGTSWDFTCLCERRSKNRHFRQISGAEIPWVSQPVLVNLLRISRHGAGVASREAQEHYFLTLDFSS